MGWHYVSVSVAPEAPARDRQGAVIGKCQPVSAQPAAVNRRAHIQSEARYTVENVRSLARTLFQV